MFLIKIYTRTNPNLMFLGVGSKLQDQPVNPFLFPDSGRSCQCCCISRGRLDRNGSEKPEGKETGPGESDFRLAECRPLVNFKNKYCVKLLPF